VHHIVGDTTALFAVTFPKAYSNVIRHEAPSRVPAALRAAALRSYSREMTTSPLVALAIVHPRQQASALLPAASASTYSQALMRVSN